MPLSWNEIRSRAHEFSRRWAGETSERAEAQSFWQEFFAVFGIDRKRVASFEKQVQITRAGERIKLGRIDAFWKGVLLIEHKSAGQDLDRAYAQAIDYFDGLKERDLPRYILVSDFARFRLYDLEAPSPPPLSPPAGRGRSEAEGEGPPFVEFPLADLHKRIKHFAFIAGYRTQEIAPQNPVNIQAAERMGRLHDLLKESGYAGHALEVLLVRLLFCLFAEDTGIFQPAGAFRLWLDERTAPDGSDLGAQLARLFQVLDTEETRRSTMLDEQLAAFPYVNGKLFAETLPIADFNAAMRDSLLECCALDWSSISPAIFGALFQSIMDGQARRNLGAHYTSEENILKLIKPLFLDELWAEFGRLKGNRNKLFEFHKRLRTLTFFDPACGCGNFLVIAYRELRRLELDVLRASHASGQQFLDIHQLIRIDVDQFYGIEIEEFPAQIAQVALWLIDHQMNVRISEEFGLYFARIPLKTTPHIHCDNALRLDWNNVLPAEKASYVFGNPPFVGKQYQTAEQKADMALVTAGIDGAGVLDLVTAWYLKAARYLTEPLSPQAGRGAGVRGDAQPHLRDPALEAKLKTYARDLRASATDAEQRLWHVLRNRDFLGFKFRRQHPLAGYILDFYCADAGLAVELDGGQHAEQATYDERRNAVLQQHGIRTLRFWNNDVLANTEAVLTAIADALPLTPALSPQAGRGSGARCAFVSTNSITQGEQVGVLWGWLLAQGMHIHFAHRTFQWSNEARGVAAVHCVIVGFGRQDFEKKVIFEYDDIRGEPHAVVVGNINPYLVEAADVVLHKRGTPICAVPEIAFGSMPNDGGHLLLNDQERNELLAQEPEAAHWIKPFRGSEEFINGASRWCLWLVGCPPQTLRGMRLVAERVARVKESRAASTRAATNKLAATPSLFGEIRQPATRYIAIPKTSSENRRLVPIGLLEPGVIASTELFTIACSDLAIFGVLVSTMHNAWVRYTCGRLKSDFRYSASLVYNNFPWPELPLTPGPSPRLRGEGSGRATSPRDRVEAAAQAVLDARAEFPESSLADLYDPVLMPPALVKAHQKLDAAVDAAYGRKSFANDAERVAFLFGLYQKYAGALAAAAPTRAPRQPRKKP